MKKNIDKIGKLTGRDKKFYDLLMQYREMVNSQMQYHVQETLMSNGIEKRGVTTHMADTGSDNSHHEMELKLMTEDGNIIQLIEEALERIVNGEFGKCRDCGEDIPEARLEARPYAVYCVKCKSIREKNDGCNPYV
ncbi:MAG: TraR/DksA family transcriptional regulator [Lentisphaeria bacterium]|nr:TraR/DksA family transcriptional regulator [Lentisphaeria bacterium]MBR7128447.1 TraR/DksA family transcriptional regulator [Lentisphaeria bacterium]